jgi:phosphoserine phosphatase
VAVTALTPSATVRAFSADIAFAGPGLQLDPGDSLLVASHNAEPMDVVIISAGDY